MKMPHLKKILASFLVATLLLASACTQTAPSRFDQAQRDSTKGGVEAVADKAVKGGSFNKFFPKSQNGYNVVYSQEKKGFAQAKLKKGSQEFATLSISDTTSTPSAASKFKTSSKKIGGYPAVSQGSTGTAVLVGDRFQVKVLSRDSSFTARDREAWLQKFNLSGLKRLK
ncbi:hypothetical protein IQ249_16880 [Lusitaniella coriacea LEGE 07157]|uniref:Lipoprotein n=1 Tax=Lusitaniella coriacea LEGE 07157 TaxID=945747 RepID=A0A8J7J4K4_9CYAN|nr:hypothetical protein [Lusitaniella coriacea]MBE9117574.1 hypothetical protein [Lusitaniella coriacea LEGE 07157]